MILPTRASGFGELGHEPAKTIPDCTSLIDMDKRAVKILFDAYWSASGWRSAPPVVTAEDFQYAKSRGVMFDPIAPSHEEAIARLRSVVAKLTVRQVVDGFLASLSTRRLDWRSALGSFAVARHLPAHQPTHEGPGNQCSTCGLHDTVIPAEHDLNVLCFERLKWGGVRHSNPVYAALDLELFLTDPPPPPTDADIAVLRDLVAALSAVPASVTSSQLHKHFPASLKANQSERDQLIAILGLCGVLGTNAHPGFFDCFVPAVERPLPNRHFVDMSYPACWWKGSDGIHTARIKELFGHVL